MPNKEIQFFSSTYIQLGFILVNQARLVLYIDQYYTYSTSIKLLYSYSGITKVTSCAHLPSSHLIYTPFKESFEFILRVYLKYHPVLLDEHLELRKEFFNRVLVR